MGSLGLGHHSPRLIYRTTTISHRGIQLRFPASKQQLLPRDTGLFPHRSFAPACADVERYQTGSEAKNVPKDYASLGDKVEAFAEGIVGGGWLWVRTQVHRPDPLPD